MKLAPVESGRPQRRTDTWLLLGELSGALSSPLTVASRIRAAEASARPFADGSDEINLSEHSAASAGTAA
jgi:hypothetical protein